jgi:hypothetical protein
MNLSRAAVLALISVAASGFAMAQTPPSQNSTAPSSASSPSQRDATSSPATEAPANTGTDPSAASTPHQQQATDGKMAGGMDKAKHDKMMKDCVTKQQAKDSSLSKDDAKKTCADQMKMSSSDKSSSYSK